MLYILVAGEWVLGVCGRKEFKDAVGKPSKLQIDWKRIVNSQDGESGQAQRRAAAPEEKWGLGIYYT